MTYDLRVTNCFGTARGIQSKHDALFSMAMSYFSRHTAREVIEATLLVNVSAKLIYYMVYPNPIKTNNNALVTMC